MEIEHINDDTIRVRIGNEDLEERGYTFLDLLGNQNQIESFFYNILEEVDLDDEFQKSDAVTFQVMPSKEGLDLLISKSADMHENFMSNWDYTEFRGDVPEEHKDYSRFESKKRRNTTFEEDIDENREESNQQEFVVEFTDFEQIILLAQTFQIDLGFSTLYEYKGKYYIEFHLLNDEESLLTPKEERAIILEYGVEASISAEVLAEYGNLLIKNEVLQEVLYYFGEKEE